MTTERREAVAAVCYQRDAPLRFLLVRTKGDKHWVLPKGGVKKHERPYEAAAREAREEAGVLGLVCTEPLQDVEYCDAEGERETLKTFLLEAKNPHRLLAPEHPVRRPTWFTLDAAVAALRAGRERSQAEGLVSVLTTANDLLSP